MKEKLKQRVLDNLQNREIVIFGAGIMAHEFYEKYRNKLNFAFCVTNNSSEWGEKRFCDELDIRQYRAQELKGKYYIVLCVYLAFDSIASQMECDDYIMVDDFIDYKVAESILDRKKLAFFYGTCNLRDIFHTMEQIPAFVEQYVSVFLQFRSNETMSEIRRLYYGKEFCDAYIYARKWINLSEAYNMQRKDLPMDCRMIGVSNITFNGYWPQMTRNILEYNEDWLFEVVAPFDNYFWHLMYAKEDTNITKLVKEGKTPNEIYKIVSADDYYNERELKKHLRVSFKTLNMAEKGLDATIGTFIQERYKEEWLYQDFTHAKKAVLWEYARQILEYLGVHEEAFATIMEESPEYIHRSSDMPIYPSVAKLLNLTWINEDTKYEVITCEGIQLMTFKEYVLHYAEYIQRTLEIKESW